MKSDKELEAATSFWNEKPWWCRPWSIVITGLIIVAISWAYFYPFITVLCIITVIIWWLLFLKIVPEQYLLSNKLNDDK
ncbi:DUF6737 family protein [Prochlorococcus sp. MIT 1341]|uniref:DUF6737 family protein n=1 Tax=Prochlorococcus sp. MIT 1341 TaxID=3096221 RepID=UPI002A74D3B5|nr:DUF6737 family protein [Prochlorococcus sp. MIT 1341]